MREAYSLLRQSIIHVEQDDIDFDDEEEAKTTRGDMQPKASQDDSQDVTMSGGDDTEMTDPMYAEPSGTDGSMSTEPQGPMTPKAPQHDTGNGHVSAKRRMVITHDKYMTLQSLIVLHLAAVERETGRGIDRDELIDWYLEMKEEEIQDVDELEYEKELITKVLRKLVKVRSLRCYVCHRGSSISAYRIIISSRSQVTYKTRYRHPWMRAAVRRVEICACSTWSTQPWIRTLHRCRLVVCCCLLSHVLSLALYVRLYRSCLRPMFDDILIVPTVLPSGSLHFASIQLDGTVGDVIHSLSAIDEVKSDVLGDLPLSGWAIQLIRKESPGRQWEGDELESLGDGTYVSNLSMNTQIYRSDCRHSGRDSQGCSLDTNRSIGSFASASFLSFCADISSSWTRLAPRLFAPCAVHLCLVSPYPRNP